MIFFLGVKNEKHLINIKKQLEAKSILKFTLEKNFNSNIDILDVHIKTNNQNKITTYHVIYKFKCPFDDRYNPSQPYYVGMTTQILQKE